MTWARARSATLKSRPRRAADYATWLGEVIDGFVPGSAPVDLVGASWGASIALNFALANQPRVRRLVLLAPASLVPWSGLLRVGARMTAIGRRGRRDPDAAIAAILGRNAAVLDELGPWMRAALGFRPRFPFSFSPPASAAKLGGLEAPVLVLLGGRDTLLGPPAPLMRRASKLPAGRIEIIAGAGHQMLLEDPARVNQETLDFLNPEGVGSSGSQRPLAKWSGPRIDDTETTEGKG